MNCKVVYDGIEYSASDFEFMLASNLLPDLSITNTSDLNEVSENTIALAALPLLSDKINSVQQEELVNWLTAEVVGYSLKNASKDITPKELLTQAFDDSKKELEYYSNVEQLKERIESILEIYPKLQEVVNQRIENFGIDFEVEDTTPEDDSENHAEDKSLKVNPYTKIGQEVKRQFFTIYDLKNVNSDGSFDAKNIKKTWFGFSKYKPINQILPTVLSYSKNLAPEYETIKSTLLKSTEANPWFASLFASIDKSNNGQIKNQFARWASKAAVNLKYLQFESSEKELKFKFNNSNSGRQVDIITNNWKNNLIDTGLFFISPDTNDYELDKLKANAIVDNFNAFSDKYKGIKVGEEYPEELFTELSNILKDIGVDIKPNELKKMQRFLDTQGMRYLSTANINFINFFVSDKGAVQYMIRQLKTPDKTESESFDKYNPLSDNTGVRALSLLYSKFQDTEVNDSYKNANNDTIYAYSPKKYATDQFERIQNIDYLTKLVKTQFASNSTWAEALLSEDPDIRYRFLEVFTLDYYDGAKGKGSSLNTPFDQLGASEQEKFRLTTFQNQGRMLEKKYRYGSTSYLTMSDKKTLISVQHLLENVDVNMDTKGVGPKAINLLYKVFEAEKKRIDAFNNAADNKSLMTKEIAAGGGEYILNPWVKPFVANGGNLNSEEQVKAAIEEYYNTIINNKLESWKELGVVQVNDKGVTTAMFDSEYVKYAKKNIPGSDNINDVILFAAIDYEVNTILGNLNLFQLFAGDPASYWKKSVDDTLVNVGKRLAAQIAPGDSLANTQFEDIAGISGHNYTQVIAQDHNYVSTSIKYLTRLLDNKEVTDKEVEDFIDGKNKKEIESKYPNAFPYFNIEATDAQEYTTALEHAYNLYHEGKLSDDVYKKLVDKLLNNKQLSEGEVKVLMQPMKPVYFNGNVVSVNGKTDTYNYYDVTYVKTSSFPLLPQLTAGTELDKLRVQLEKLQDPTDSKDPKKIKLVRMVMSTGIKVGSVQKPVKVFNNDGSVNENIDFANSTKNLTRDGYRIQLEVPLKDKNEINRGTQEIKLLFTDLLDHKFANGKTGLQLRTEFNNLNKELFQTQLEILKNELKVDDKGNFDIQLLREKLVKEALSRNFSVNEIQALELVDIDTNGQFVVPLVFSNSSDKFESLLISLIDNSVRKQKQVGFSSPLGSNSGFKFQNDLKGINKNDIIWVEDYDPTKLLQQQQIVDGKVRGSQVLVPWKFRDNSGKMLNIQDFIKEVNGVKTIDHEKLPKELLQSFGFRIPTQGLNSMGYLEIVGFLPEEAGDLLIAPPEFTKQMGSDFDIDKLYSYLYSTFLTKDGVLKKYKWDSETNEEFIENYKKQLESEAQYDKLIAAIFGETAASETLEKLISDKEHVANLRRAKALQNEILDIHFTVLTDPSKEVQKKIVTALGFGKLGDLKTKYDNAAEKVSEDVVKMSPLSSQYQTKKYLSARGGKAGTGYFSSLNVFVSVMQGLDLRYNIPVNLGDKVVWQEQKLTINKVGTGLSSNKDNTGELKSENAVAYQSASVDDEKEQIMASLNITADTFYAIGAWTLDGHSQEAVVGIITQPIIKEYLDLVNSKQDIFSGYVKGADIIAFNEIFEKYAAITGLTTEQLGEIDFENQILTEDELWNGFKSKDKNTNWALLQLSALTKFRQADSMGKSLQKVITAFSIDSKGLGKSFIESNVKEATIKELLDSKQISNIQKLYNESIGGISSQVSLTNLNKMFSKYFPYNTVYNNTVRDLYFLYTGKNDLRQEQKEKEFRDLYNDMKSSLYSSMLKLPQEDLYARRKDLMYGEDSLARRLKELQRTSKNPFLIKLNINLGKTTTEPDTVSMRSIGGELFTDDDVYNGFLDLFYNESTRQLAKDLVDYFYINGGIQKAREYSRYIPTSFLVASGYANSLRSFDLNDLSSNLGSPEEFLLQYVRNNPGKAPQLSDKDYKKNDDGSLTVTSDMFTYASEHGSLPMPYVTLTERVTKSQTPKNNDIAEMASLNAGNFKIKYNLYMFDSNTSTYRQIPLLGFTSKNYSAKEYGSRISAFEDNRIDDVSTNIESIKESQKPAASNEAVIPNITKIAQTDYTILGIKTNNNVEDIKTTLSIINTGTSRALVYLLDKANPDLEMVVHKGQNMYSPSENKVYINNGLITESKIKVAVIHEITHSVTSKIINKILEDPNKPNYEGLSDAQKLAYIRLNNTYTNFIQEIFDKGIQYNGTTLTKEGLLEYRRKLDALKKGEKVDFSQADLNYNPFLNLKEFLAEAFSNKAFQNLLNSQTYKGDKSWLQKLIEDIANFLNKFSIQGVNAESILAQTLYDGFVLADVTIKKQSSVKQNVEITKANYTRQEVQNNPNTAYVFTENTHSITAFPDKQGGGSAVIRPEPNAYAIVTKKKYDYNTRENVDYTDTPENFKEFTEINTKLINDIKNSGKSKIVFPQGFATDKAKMPTRFAEWLQKALLDNFGLITELNSTKTGLISKSISQTIQPEPKINDVPTEPIEVITEEPVVEETTVNEFKFPDGTVIQTGNIKLNNQQQEALTNIADFINKKLMQSDVTSDVDFTWTLQGYAGTGKTTITKYIVQYLKKKRVGYKAASPTHRAKEVLMDSIGEKAYTLASILGLQPGVELEEFNLQDKKFTQQNEVKIPTGGVLIIDEASMINDELYDFVISLAGQKGTKVLFIGDDAQLKPVKQRSKSKAFRRDNHISKLTKVMRTADGNPMPSEVLQKIRDNQSSKEDMFEHKTMLNSKGDGIIFLDNEKDFTDLIKHEFTLQKFLDNRFSIRAVAYTNDRVRQLNDMIRINMFGFSADKFNEGEMIMMYENIGYNYADQDYDFPNGSDNVVVKSVPVDNKRIINPVTGKVHEVKGWDLTLVRAKDNAPRSQNLFVADMTVVSEEYLKDLNQLKDLALQQGLSKAERGKRWSDYYKFASQYLLMDNVYLYNSKAYVSDKEIKKQLKADNPSLSDSQISYQASRLKAKDKTLDYSYAHTIHKSQGGTYDKVLVDENNIDIAKRFPSPDYEMINQLKYVAFSRSSKQTIVLSSKSDGRLDAQDVIDINQLDNLEDAIDYNDLLPDYSVSLQKDLGMDNLEFMRMLSKEDRESYRRLLNNNILKVKCNG